MNRIKILLFLTLLTVINEAKIRQLDSKNLAKFMQDESYWLIQVSKKQCPKCQKDQLELEMVSKLLEGVVKVAKTSDSQLLKNFQLKQNPTYLFTRSDEPQKAVTLSEKLINKNTLSKFCLAQLTKWIKYRNEKLFINQQNNKNNKNSQNKNNQQKSSTKINPELMVQLNDNKFEKVFKSSSAWLIQFYSPSCGHCQAFQPQYSKLPKMIGKRVRIAKIDATKFQKYASQFQIKGFPTVLFFSTDDKEKPLQYEGQRSADAIINWLKDKKIGQEKQQLLQLTKNSYESECNKNIICFIFILDNIKKDINKLNHVKSVMEESPNKPIKYFYSGHLLGLETQLMIEDRSCPKMIAIWDTLNSYRVYNDAQNYDSLSQFVNGLLNRKKWIKFREKPLKLLFENSVNQL